MRISKFLIGILVVVLLAGLFYWKAEQNYLHQDYVNSNFFSFWLSGHMVWTGQSPYDAAQWKAGFDAVHATYRPSAILQYPLPLMYFMAPIGALPVGSAYFAWNLLSQILIALSVFLLLRVARAPAWLVLPIMALLLFFGPVFLTLQIGAVGSITLLAVALAIFLLETDRPVLAGVALAVTLLKPPQALTLLALAGIWFLARRQWKAIAGIVLGGLLLLVVWLLRDPQWLSKFQGSSGFLLAHTLGSQSNVFNLAYLACGRNETCMWGLGAVGALVVLGVGAYVLWLKRQAWTDWQAFSFMIPLSFLTALYMWSYDQIIYVIPMLWIATRLLARPRRYLLALGALLVIDGVSFVALMVEAYSHQDLTSLATTVLILGLVVTLQGRKDSAAVTGRSAAAGVVP